MPRKPSFPPKPHHHKASGQARVTWRGKQYYLGQWGSPEAEREYKRVIAELVILEQITHNPGADPRITISEAIAHWVAKEGEPRFGKGDKRLVNYLNALAPLVRLCGSRWTTDLDANLLEEVRDAMASGSWLTRDERIERKARRIPVQWSRRVVNRRIAQIRTVWRWVERKKLASPGSAAHLETLPPLAEGDLRAREKEERKPIPWFHLQCIVRHASPTVRDMLLFQWWTGCRSGEVRQMKAEEIDMTDDVWVFSPKHHKNSHRGQRRDIVIGAKAQAVLRPYLHQIKQGYVFSSGPGRCYTQHSYAHAFQRAAKRAKLDHYGYSPYSIRHAAKMRFAAALGIEAAKSALGHKSMRTTEDYGVIDIDLAKRLARKAG